jgi:hypothetical protein
VASPTPKPYIARLFLTHDFGFGSAKEQIESDVNQLAGERPMTRYSIYAGRFSVTDFFDNNNYTHDPRTQFMAWAVMYSGAWDYPADTRGYTWGIVQEFHTKNWGCDTGSPPNRDTPMAPPSTGGYSATTGKCGKLNAAIPCGSATVSSVYLAMQIARRQEITRRP